MSTFHLRKWLNAINTTFCRRPWNGVLSRRREAERRRVSLTYQRYVGGERSSRVTAFIGRAKLADYLLSPSHPSGRHKASFFESFGFGRDACEELSDALLLHARSNDVVRSEVSRFGVKS